MALVGEGNQVCGTLRFHSYHRRELFGIAPTGRRLGWYGTPMFRFEYALIRELWVLGDEHCLIARLKGDDGTQQPLVALQASVRTADHEF